MERKKERKKESEKKKTTRDRQVSRPGFKLWDSLTTKVCETAY